MAERLTRLLLDTSVVIAGSEAVKLNRGDTAAISVITIGELRAGVRLAGDPNTHAIRQARLAAVRETFEPLPVDEPVAEHYGEILAAARAQKRTSKATDLLIIATAAATGAHCSRSTTLRPGSPAWPACPSEKTHPALHNACRSAAETCLFTVLFCCRLT